MTPAFDAAIAECARLRLRWEWYEDSLSPLTLVVENVLVFATDEPDDAVHTVRVALAKRCCQTQFKRRR